MTKANHIEELSTLHDLLNKARVLAEELNESCNAGATEPKHDIDFSELAYDIEQSESAVFDALQAERGE